MAKVQLTLGAEIDMLNAGELSAGLEKQSVIESQREMERLRGISYMRMPQLQGTAVAGVLLLPTGGGQQQQSAGPRDGYVWTIKRLMVTGLAAGDVVGIYADTTSSQPLWTLSAANPNSTFPTLGMVLFGGQTLIVANIGTFTSTAVINISGDVLQVPTVMIGKLA